MPTTDGRGGGPGRGVGGGAVRRRRGGGAGDVTGRRGHRGDVVRGWVRVPRRGVRPEVPAGCPGRGRGAAPEGGVRRAAGRPGSVRRRAAGRGVEGRPAGAGRAVRTGRPSGVLRCRRIQRGRPVVGVELGRRRRLRVPSGEVPGVVRAVGSGRAGRPDAPAAGGDPFAGVAAAVPGHRRGEGRQAGRGAEEASRDASTRTRSRTRLPR